MGLCMWLGVLGMELSTSEGQLCFSIEANAVRLPPTTVRKQLVVEHLRHIHKLQQQCECVFVSAGGL